MVAAGPQLSQAAWQDRGCQDNVQGQQGRPSIAAQPHGPSGAQAPAEAPSHSLSCPDPARLHSLPTHGSSGSSDGRSVPAATQLVGARTGTRAGLALKLLLNPCAPPASRGGAHGLEMTVAPLSLCHSDAASPTLPLPSWLMEGSAGNPQ